MFQYIFNILKHKFYMLVSSSEKMILMLQPYGRKHCIIGAENSIF